MDIPYIIWRCEWEIRLKMVVCSLQRLIAGGYARQIMYVDQFYVLLTPRLIKLPSLLWVNLEPSNFKLYFSESIDIWSGGTFTLNYQSQNRIGKGPGIWREEFIQFQCCGYGLGICLGVFIIPGRS